MKRVSEISEADEREIEVKELHNSKFKNTEVPYKYVLK